jgi:Protein of unknown function (DUF3617)
MRSAILGIVAVGLSLSGCGSKEAASGVVKRDAGSWKSEISINKFELPGAPPEAKQMMEGMMKMASAVEVCLTPEQAAKDDIATDMANGQAAKDCQFSKKNVSGGTIDVEGICKNGRGETVNMKIAGTVESKKTDALISVSGKSPMGAGQMNMEMKVVSTWTGACKPGQPTKGESKTTT